MDLTKALFRGDRVIWAIFFILCMFSLVEVYSASSMLSYKATVRHFDPIMRHSTFLLGGTLLVIVVQNINYKKFSTLGFYILIFAFILLIYALAGGMKVNDAQRWVSFGGVSFQPSEFAKLGVIITTSYILARFQDESHASNNAFKWVMWIAGFFCLLIVKENFSTAFLLFSVVYILMFIGRVQLKKLGIIMLIGIVKKNAIMMIDFALDAQRKEGKSAEDAIYSGCLIRFRPIMMTTMAALMGTLPIALGMGAGSESRRPLGIAVVGGLVFSQLMTLYITPVVYTYLESVQQWARRRFHTGRITMEEVEREAAEPVGMRR